MQGTQRSHTVHRVGSHPCTGLGTPHGSRVGVVGGRGLYGVASSCYNKSPVVGGLLKQQNYALSQSCSLEIQNRGVGRVAFECWEGEPFFQSSKERIHPRLLQLYGAQRSLALTSLQLRLSICTPPSSLTFCPLCISNSRSLSS